MVLATYPIEYMAAITPGANPEPTWRLYQALAHAAGATPAVSFDTPRMNASLMRHDDGRVFVWCVSQSETELSNDLLIGARLLQRAATGMPRKLRDPLIEAAEALRKPGDPFTRAGAAQIDPLRQIA